MVNEEAEDCKKKGNDAFKERNWDEAIKQYNKAISLDPTNAAYYSNRSGAWSSKGHHDSALSDANKCLGHDPQFVKGYARKGKALFDMDKWDEAEVAYRQGLEVEPTNDSCARGLTDIAAARQRRRAGGAGGRTSGMASFVPKLVERFKKGGRMQSYLVVLLAYYAFTSLTGRASRKSSEADRPSTHEAPDYDDDAEAPVQTGRLARQFQEIEGLWLSSLQLRGKSDAALLLLHRTSLSADAEYAAALPKLAAAAPSGLRLLAPDRPCHGYSPCPPAGEPVNASAWLGGLLAGQPTPRRLALVAAGREAAAEVLALARRRPEVAHVWLLAPSATAPVAERITTAAELHAWLQEQRGLTTAQAASDAARWAALGSVAITGGSEQPESTDLDIASLHKRCKVTVLCREDTKEDVELGHALEAKGVKVKVRSMGMGETLLDALVDDVQQVMGDADAEAEEDE